MRYTICIAGLLSTAVVAQDQKVDVSIRPVTEGAWTYTIETKSEIDNQRKVLIDGEEMGGGRAGGGGGGRRGGGGFGGGNGVVSTAIKFVVDEGVADGGRWRQYHTAEASVSRGGDDGEPRVVKSGLEGKKVFVLSDDAGTVLLDGSPKGEALPAALTEDVPEKLDFSGLAPSTPVAIGAEFDISKTLRRAFANLSHPVSSGAAPQRPAGGEAGGRGGRGGAGGGEAGGRGGRGGRGGFGGRGAFPVSDSTVAYLTNDKLDLEAVGKVVAVENGIAHVEFRATYSGKGSMSELGMMGAFGRGGRGGRGGGGGGGAEDDSKASVELTIEGKMAIDTTAHRLDSLTLTGKLASNGEMFRETQRGDMEMTTSANGSLAVAISCAECKEK